MIQLQSAKKDNETLTKTELTVGTQEKLISVKREIIKNLRMVRTQDKNTPCCSCGKDSTLR